MPNPVQKKFIAVSAVVLCAVVVLVLVAVNVGFASRTDARVAQLLQFVIEYGDDPEGAKDALETRGAAILAETSGQTPYEALCTASYFTADVSADLIVTTDLLHAVELAENEAKALVEAARVENLDTGRVGTYQYTRQTRDDGTMLYAFADVSTSLMQSVQLGTSSFGIGAIALSALLVYVWAAVMMCIRPLEAKVGEGARLLSGASVRLYNVSDGPPEAVDGIADDLAAGSLVLESGARRPAVFSLSQTVEKACDGAAAAVEARGRFATDLQQEVRIRGHQKEISAMCRILLGAAARIMPQGGSTNVDLLSDGRSAGLIVRFSCAPWESGSPPTGDELDAVRLIARSSNGAASFEAIAPDVQCYMVRFRAAGGPRTPQEADR